MSHHRISYSKDKSSVIRHLVTTLSISRSYLKLWLSRFFVMVGNNWPSLGEEFSWYNDKWCSFTAYKITSLVAFQHRDPKHQYLHRLSQPCHIPAHLLYPDLFTLISQVKRDVQLCKLNAELFCHEFMCATVSRKIPSPGSGMQQ
jgi:hypothetical protein